VKADLRWSQFGVMAKGFEWGIAVHQGMQYGWLNRIVMLIGCLAVWLLAISGLIMWWKRRPPSLSRRSSGAPTAPAGPRARIAVLCIVIPLSILYPLTVLSLVAALALRSPRSATTIPKSYLHPLGVQLLRAPLQLVPPSSTLPGTFPAPAS